MQALESRDLLDRAVEMLPSTTALAEREAKGQKLTRPELGVLLAYAKLALFDDLVASDLPDDPHFEADLFAYFPAKMTKKFAGEIKQHRLRREIVATMLANDAINRGGPSFVSRMQDLTGRTAADVVAAYAVVRDGFDLTALYAEIDALDGQIDGDAQLDLYLAVGRLVHVATLWQLRNHSRAEPVAARIATLRAARKLLEPGIDGEAPVFAAERMEERAQDLIKSGAPEKLARRIALLNLAELIPDIALLAKEAGAGLPEAAHAFFAITAAFRVGRIVEAARSIQPADYYDGLAQSRALEAIGVARRAMAASALAAHGREAEPVESWLAAGGERVVQARERLVALTEGGDLTVSRLTVAAGLMSDLG